MVNDNTIDEQNAKYWCMFMDDGFANALDEAMQYNKDDGAKLAKIAKKLLNKKNFAESIDEGMWDNVQAMHQAAFPLATGNPYQPNFRALDPSSGVKSLQAQGKDNVVAAATTAALVGTSVVPGGWAALGTALGTALGSVGSSLATAATSLGANALFAIVGGIVSVSTYLYPRISKMLHEFNRNGTIAKCNFEADGQTYQAVFSTNVGRWELVYTNNRWLRVGTHVPSDDVATFFQTQMFRNFLKQCKKHVSKVYFDENRKKCLKTIAAIADKKSKKDLNEILDAEQLVKNYMLSGKYST